MLREEIGGGRCEKMGDIRHTSRRELTPMEEVS